MASSLGRTCARLGSETALAWDAGFYNAFTGNNRGELCYVFTGLQQTALEAVVADLGTGWELLHVTPKFYPRAGYDCPVIDLMAQLRARHAMPAADIARITVDMNLLERLCHSPAFPNPVRGAPGVGSTRYFTAYTCVHGSFEIENQRLGG
jgi:hypothetical protein